jgi:hypothetical protein
VTARRDVPGRNRARWRSLSGWYGCASRRPTTTPERRRCLAPRRTSESRRLRPPRPAPGSPCGSRSAVPGTFSVPRPPRPHARPHVQTRTSHAYSQEPPRHSLVPTVPPAHLERYLAVQCSCYPCPAQGDRSSHVEQTRPPARSWDWHSPTQLIQADRSRRASRPAPAWPLAGTGPRQATGVGRQITGTGDRTGHRYGRPTGRARPDRRRLGVTLGTFTTTSC